MSCTKHPGRVLATLLCTLFLTACSLPKKEYVPPRDQAGVECLEHCNTDRFRCRTHARRLKEDCERRYEQALVNYNICVRRGYRLCRRPQRCGPIELHQCSDMYEACYLGCGGRIIEDSPDQEPGSP